MALERESMDWEPMGEEDGIYGYGPEEILPVVIYLTNKYTSGESSSIPCEKAEMLMEAVLYCIRECFAWNAAGVLSVRNHLSAREAYDKGYAYVMEKVKLAKALYESLLADFEDYGCLNYRKTVLEGLPAFFLNYDIRFCPQDHILTLDYPDMACGEELRGADRIYTYLSHLCMEKEFLAQFDRQAVCRVLADIQPDYEELYLDNICEAVLFQAVKCVITDSPVRQLEGTVDENRLLRIYFEGDTRGEAARKTEALIEMLTGAMGQKSPGTDRKSYFGQMGGSFSARYLLQAGMHNRSFS